LRLLTLAWSIDAESEVALAENSCWSSLSLVVPPETVVRNLRSFRGARRLTWFHEIHTVMSTSALPVSGDCVVAPNCIDLSTDFCNTLQQDSCEQMRRCSASLVDQTLLVCKEELPTVSWRLQVPACTRHAVPSVKRRRNS